LYEHDEGRPFVHDDGRGAVDGTWLEPPDEPLAAEGR
jgi:hypothetical protein